MFSDIFDIRRTHFQPKPQRIAFDCFLQHYNLDPSTCLFIDDLPVNVLSAQDAGMWAGWMAHDMPGDVDVAFRITDLEAFLASAQSEALLSS